MAELKIGDVVQLNSGGGLRMTIRTVNKDTNKAECVWVDENNKQQTAVYELTLLSPAGPSVMTAPVSGSQRTRGF
jgi:uncharacterized protein YodC (DUF2158 family)